MGWKEDFDQALLFFVQVTLGKTDAAEFRDRAIFATRQLAKRQITWLRSDVGTRVFDPDTAHPLARAVDAVELFLGRPC